jgi:hypothetical protein
MALLPNGFGGKRTPASAIASGWIDRFASFEALLRKAPQDEEGLVMPSRKALIPGFRRGKL